LTETDFFSKAVLDALRAELAADAGLLVAPQGILRAGAAVRFDRS
jgi:hypothetical protein